MQVISWNNPLLEPLRTFNGLILTRVKYGSELLNMKWGTGEGHQRLGPHYWNILWDGPEVDPSSRYQMEEQVYPKAHHCIGWPDFREAHMQAMNEDKKLCNYAESFYWMYEEQWMIEEAFRNLRVPSPLTPELVLLTKDDSIYVLWSFIGAKFNVQLKTIYSIQFISRRGVISFTYFTYFVRPS